MGIGEKYTKLELFLIKSFSGFLGGGIVNGFCLLYFYYSLKATVPGYKMDYVYIGIAVFIVPIIIILTIYCIVTGIVIGLLFTLIDNKNLNVDKLIDFLGSKFENVKYEVELYKIAMPPFIAGLFLGLAGIPLIAGLFLG